ncbi:MAG TPA: leucine-rich repeat domain-containing protein [Rhabdochlamydiaceae bacterium]
MQNITNPLCTLPLEALVRIRSYVDGTNENAFPATCQDLRTGDLAYRSIEAQQVRNLIQTVDSPLSRSLQPLAAMTLNTSEDLCAFNREVAKVVGSVSGTVQKDHVVQAKEIVSTPAIQDRALLKIWPVICQAILKANPLLTLDPKTMTAQDIRKWMHDNRSELENVYSLYLAGMDLSCLPKEITLLTNLRSLFLSRNRLTMLPDSFGQLTNLEQLHLHDNRLTKLPDSFGQLVNLQRLDLNNNQLQTLPDSFGQLVNLKHLLLSANKLTTLPDSFGQFANLKYLFLSDNQLKMLPNSIGLLSNLQVLYLRHNQLTELPAEIVNLVALERLNLSNNLLTQLPPKNWFENINWSTVDHNPITYARAAGS